MMRKVACVVLVALAVGVVSAQSPAPNATVASPAPVANVTAPAANATVVTPALPAIETSPVPSPEASPSPAPAETEPAAGAAAVPGTTVAPVKAANVTNTQVSEYFSSPLFAIQNTDELEELAKLGAGSDAFKLLSDRKLVATIFAPNNDAVTSAVNYLANATGADAETLVKQGVVEQLLAYHVAKGAAVLEGNFKNNQTLTMLDGNKTTIMMEEATPARKLLQAGNATYYIVSDSNQRFKLTGPANIQGGRAMIHIIDGVLVPQALLDKYNITETADLPGASAAATADGAMSRDITPASEAPAPTARSSATKTAAAALLAVPALLAALVL